MSKKHSGPLSGIVKKLVYYHRSYRKIRVPQKRHFIPFLFLIVLIEVSLYLSFPDLNLLVNQHAQKILVRSIPSENVELIWTEFLWRPITVLSVPGSYPGRWFSIINLLAALLLVIVVPKMKVPKPIVVPLTLVSLIHIVSALFFLIVPDRFPYHVLDFTTTFAVLVIVTCPLPFSPRSS
jgi:hypothetical protein